MPTKDDHEWILLLKKPTPDHVSVIQAYDTPYNYCPNCGRKIKED